MLGVFFLLAVLSVVHVQCVNLSSESATALVEPLQEYLDMVNHFLSYY